MINRRRAAAGLLAAALLFNGAGRVSAENLVSVRAATLPALGGPIDALIVVQDRPIAVRGGSLWQLNEARDGWFRIGESPRGRIHGAIHRPGAAPLVLLESEAGRGAVRVETFTAGRPESAAQNAVESPKSLTLPEPLTHARGVVLGDVLRVLGTTAAGTSAWFSISLASGDQVWQPESPLPAAARVITSFTAQDSTLLLTARTAAGQPDDLWRWKAATGWMRQGPMPGMVVDGAARAIGQAHVLFVVEPVAGDAGTAQPLVPQLITYHTITDAFASQGQAATALVRRAVPLGDGLLLELASADAAASEFLLAEIIGSKQLLQPIDWLMIIAYLVAIAGIGVYCFRREAKLSTSEFFVGSRTIPFWAAAVSLYVTSTSSIGYIGTTAKAFATNWQYLVGNIMTAFALFFVAIWIVPMLRRLRLVSVFDYLEQRFHPAVRMMASAMCILLHLSGRMSIILFLPAFAIATITGFSVVWSILIMGVVTMGYTALGGMRAVIWTDFLQLLVKVGGLIFALVFIWAALKVDLGTTVAAAEVAGKTRMWDWSFDLTQATVWGFVLVAVMETVLTFPKDQVLMQRVFTTKSDKEAGRSVWLFAAIIIPGAWLFYAIGTGLWAYYRENPERMNPLLAVDATFPLFIAAELPAGVTGLMIAGIFAASMATCSSIMNSVATMVSVDFYERLAKKPTQTTSIRIAEWVTVLAGLIGIGLALLLSRYSISSYLDIALELYGLMGGGFGGAYTLGMFSRRANWQGVLIGMLASVVLTLAAWWVDLVHPVVYLGLSIMISIVVGYVASLFFPPPKQEGLDGLIVQR